MRVFLKLVLDCAPDAAWRAVRSPSVFRAVSAPLTTFESLEPGGFPEVWSTGVHPVQVKALGLFPLGEQTIDVSFEERANRVRMMHDDGRGLSGPLAAVATWHHAMAISPARGGRTLYRDQLVFEAGALTPLLWIAYWTFWQWRSFGLRRFAPTWPV